MLFPVSITKDKKPATLAQIDSAFHNPGSPAHNEMLDTMQEAYGFLVGENHFDKFRKPDPTK